jgi:hypothetical protein
MTNGIVLQDELKRALRWLTVAVVVMYLVMAIIGGGLFISANHQRAEISTVNARTSDALCALVHDIERRIAGAQDFLDKNPEGSTAIPAVLIRQTIQNQRQTLEALSPLNCPPGEL